MRKYQIQKEIVRYDDTEISPDIQDYTPRIKESVP
jgi:hypothetical protein